ncbi:S41 family peptidase [Mucilaginibacter ximonensis]|uniref:S41 family peptidase n=1 Tax=Mucilaginibacter ximonensis TaxID=538021 RepID=A0ABW5Y8H4_9SPHI
MKRTILGILMTATLFTACKKSNPSTNNNNNNNGGGASTTGSTLDLIRDSVYLYAKEDYYWYNTIPSYTAFNPRQFSGSTDLEALQKEVNAISQTNTFEYYAPSPGEAKYSFIDQGEVSTELGGTNGDFGFGVLYNEINDLRVKYVYPGSPADVAGIKRGYQITAINNNTNINYDNGGTNTNFVINAIFSSKNVTLTLLRPDQTSFTTTLAAASYTINPVITYKTINLPNNKVLGYMVFNSFTSDNNADPKLDQAFSYFQSQGVTELVVDLRYNGGGYVSTAEYIDNYLVPSSANNTTMYAYHFNDILANNKETLLANQYRRDGATNQLYNLAQVDYSVAANTQKFNKKGGLNLSRVFFIVSGSTASASELTINNLRPHMDVQFIGTTTYGKPVGFFDIDINKYQMYIPEFETQNSAGQGGYYSGMTPGAAGYPGVKDYDDPTKEFGDTTEVLLHHAVNFLKKGTYTVTAPKVQGLNVQRTLSIDQSNAAALALESKKFKGMVYDKSFVKKK